MPKLGTLVEFGPRAKWFLGEGLGKGRWSFELPVRGVFDLSNGAAYRGLALEPELAYSRISTSGWAYKTSISAVAGNRRLADTYYGVDAAFATPTRPAYAAQSGLVALRVGTSVSKSIHPDWRLFGVVRFDSVNGAANVASPLVRQKDGLTLGLGLSYTWMRSTSSAKP